MRTRKSFIPAFSSLVLIPTVFIVILLDKPDYTLFNFVHGNIIPIAETVGRGLTYPARAIGRFAESRMKRRESLKDNDEIMAKLETLERVTVEKEALERENELLMSKLNMAEKIKYKTAVARIVRSVSFMENQMFMAENPRDEIAAGNIVVSNTGFILGVIVEKNGRYSKIQSVRDGHSNIPVRIAGTDVFGFLYGAGNSAPELKFLSDGDFIPAAGMFLVTSGVNGKVPDDIPVGRIESVETGAAKVGLGAELKNQESVMLLLFDKNRKYE